MRSQKVIVRTFAFLAEHTFLAAALFFCIPVVLSDVNHQRHSLAVPLIAVLVFFGLSRSIAIWQDRETIIGAIVKCIIMAGFAVAVYARVTGWCSCGCRVAG